MKYSSLAALAALLALGGCATPKLDNSAGRRVVYQDVVSMSDRRVRDILANPQMAGRAAAPRIIIDSEYFSNDSSSRINKNMITDRLRIGLNRAAQGRLVFVARHYGDMVAREREAKRTGEHDAGTIIRTCCQMHGDAGGRRQGRGGNRLYQTSFPVGR